MKLAPSRDGARVAALAGGEVRVIELGRGTSRSAPAPDATELALFDGELWVVGGSPPILRRLTLELRETAAIELPEGVGLVRAPFGPPAALWIGPSPRVISGEAGALQATAISLPSIAPRQVAMLSTQRIAIAVDRAIVLSDGDNQRWRHDLGAEGEVLAIGPLFEGRALAAVVGRGDGASQHLLVLNVRDGGLQHRLALQGVTAAWFAAHRGLAVLAAGPHQLLVVDLRFGRVLRQHDEARVIADVAFDDAGEHLVVRLVGDGEDEVVDLPVRELIAGTVRVRDDADEAAPPAPEAPSVATAVAPAPSFPTERARAVVPVPLPIVEGPLRALRPVTARPEATRAEALGLLEHYRRLAAAVTGLAITRGWDTGSIAFVDESRPPFEREVAALLLDVHDLAQPQLRAAQAAAAAATDALDQAERALDGRRPPLASLADELGLSPLAQHLLLLVAAPSLWGELARPYGILANDPDRALCDEFLLTELAQGRADRNQVARELDRDQPLQRHGLIRVAGDRARPFAALSVDPLVLKILRGDPLDEDLDAGTHVVAATRPLETLRVPAGELARVLLAMTAADDGGPLRLVIRGRAGSGRRTIAAALAARAGRRLGVVDAARLLRERRIELLGVQLGRCALRGWLPMVEGLEAIASEDSAAREQVRDLLRAHPGPVLLRLSRDATPPVDPGFVVLDLPPLTVAERADHWRGTLDAHGLAVRDLDELAARFAIGPGLIERVVAQVAGSPAPPTTLADAELDLVIRQHLASQLGQVATRVTRLANWSQVILPPDILDSVLELISRIRHRRIVYDTWGFDRVMATSRGVTALFQGGPGTGKTMVASAIANELGLDIYRVDLSRVMSKWIGETEQNLARVFDAAEEGQAILLFDEADSLFAKRTEVRSSVDRYANLEVNYLLQRFDSFEGIAILTTNFGTAIDPAFKRRLSFRLTFPFPDDDTRELLWKAHLPEDLPRRGELELADLARRYRMSGGYIRNAALRAAFIAAEERTVLSHDHLERAIRAEFREIGKLAETGILE